MILSPHVYGEDQHYIDTTVKSWSHFELKGLLDSISTDKAGNMACNYTSDPIVIKMKEKCGTYCYAGIKCTAGHAISHDDTFVAGAFCKTNGKTCPSAVECYEQSKTQSPKIKDVRRDKHTAAIISFTSEEIEAKELKPSDDIAGPHTTSAEQIQLIREREAKHKERVKEGKKQKIDKIKSR